MGHITIGYKKDDKYCLEPLIKHNGDIVKGVTSVEINLCPNSPPTAIIRLGYLNIHGLGELLHQYYCQGQRVKKIIYEDGSFFPPEDKPLTMNDINAKEFKRLGIPRIY